MGRSEIHLPADWSKAAAGPSNRYEGKTFTSKVLLDGATFEGCVFRGAVLIYAGGAPPRITNCTFIQTSFEFQDAASRTLTFLQAMAAPSSGLSAVFKASFARLFGH